MINIAKSIYSKAVKSFIEKHNFIPLRECDGEPIADKYMLISRNSENGPCILEIIDGDRINYRNTEGLIDLILNKNDFKTIDPLNFYIKVYLFSEFKSNDFSEITNLLEQRHSGTSEFKNLAYILIDSIEKTVFSLGLVSPYYLVREVLKDCLKDPGNSTTNPDMLPSNNYYEKSIVLFEEHYRYDTFTHITVYSYIFYILMVINVSLWAGTLSSLMGNSLEGSVMPIWKDSDLLSIGANLAALFVIVQMVEINYNVRKLLLITILGGILGGIPASSYSCFYNWVLPACGALLYIKYRAKGVFDGRKHILYILYSYLILTAILIFLRDGIPGFASCGGIVAGFFISGIVHFQEEFVDKSKNRNMWIGLVLTVFLLIITRASFF